MFDAKKTTEAITHLNKLCGMLHSHIHRSYPSYSVRGSQCREDEKVMHWLSEGPGTYVDIGAADPIECSNTWLLYNRGWRGLLIEPLFWYWPHILRERRGDMLVGSAVRNYTGHTILRVQGSVSSVMPSWNIEPVAELLVDCEKGQDILDQFAHIRDSCQFCSIDVEGAEAEVIESIDWNVFKPKVVCVEYKSYNPQGEGEDLSTQWKSILTKSGYIEEFSTTLNKVYVRQ